MPGTLRPAQDYDHLITVVSGSNSMHDLQFEAQAGPNQTFVRGSFVRTSTAVPPLLIKGGVNAFMPLWAINAAGDFDVNGDKGNFIDNKVGCWVATGGYEVFTTEFVAGTYAPNALLTWSAGSPGKVTASPTNYNDNDVVGCVSKGVTTDVYGQIVLNFWTLFVPKAALR